jgi:hypothetical protein
MRQTRTIFFCGGKSDTGLRIPILVLVVAPMLLNPKRLPL